ncbi:unnamed protein product [Protopolystoma xenopodis]|uniref:Uncharacterized protein n=1 Tax=Protopolystoma xenopodis TaxID=117903 RepID=A0A3S5AV96_9PLAT|nr:unnamed protein product [Protopolystoma xenopodis]
MHSHTSGYNLSRTQGSKAGSPVYEHMILQLIDLDAIDKSTQNRRAFVSVGDSRDRKQACLINLASWSVSVPIRFFALITGTPWSALPFSTLFMLSCQAAAHIAHSCFSLQVPLTSSKPRAHRQASQWVMTSLSRQTAQQRRPLGYRPSDFS